MIDNLDYATLSLKKLCDIIDNFKNHSFSKNKVLL